MIKPAFRTALTCGLALALFASFAPRADAAIHFINFESDPPGPQLNGFMSFDSNVVTFFDSMGADLFVADFGIASHGRALAVGGNDQSALIMNFSMLVDSLSMEFGNDDPALTADGDGVFLTTYLNGNFVGQTFVFMNRNTAMDQSISFSGAVFDSAVLEYYVTGDGLMKVVDNIEFNVIPGPEVTGLLIAAALARFRRRRG
jgi:hypothetical protein